MFNGLPFHKNETETISRLINLMENSYANNQRYVTLKDLNLFRKEIDIINANPILFFKCSSTRMVLTKWIIDETEELFIRNQYKALSVDYIYNKLRDNFKTLAFNRSNLQRLFCADKVLDYYTFIPVRNSVRDIYNEHYKLVSPLSREEKTKNDFKLAKEDLGEELFEHFLKNTDQAMYLFKILSHLVKEMEYDNKLRMAIEGVHKNLLLQRVKPLLHAFKIKKELRDKLMQLFTDNNIILAKELSRLSTVPIENTIKLPLVDFVRWLADDKIESIRRKFQMILKTERNISILKTRATGATLDITGQKFGITRERVRQIERKLLLKFISYCNIHKPYYVLQACTENNTVLTFDTIRSQFGDLSDVFIYCLKQCKSKEAIWNDKLEGFILTGSKITSQIENEMKNVVTAIIEERFPNGIRPNSVIDINKLKNFYREATGKEMILEGNAVHLLLREVGICLGEKVFVIPKVGMEDLAKLVECLISEGNKMFFYDQFYDLHADFLQGINIFSSELLRIVLSRILPSLRYARNYFTKGRVSIESEVFRCFDIDSSLTYGQLAAKLPYVPINKIKHVLTQNNDYIRVCAGVYTHVSKVKVDVSEWKNAEDKVKDDISQRGFASLNWVDVSKSLELNPDLSETAIRNGLFQIYLADRYEKRGNIITPKGATLNFVTVFEDYCLTHDRLTLAELLDLEKEIRGSVNNQSLIVAYDTMVRIDKETFVSDDKISFDIDAIDNALSSYVYKNVIPLRAVKSFISFPYIQGYQWNLFLLESYCRRFSKLFGFQCLSVNSKNVGAIYRKESGFTDYIEVLATAVADSDVDLKERTIGDFLFESGYVARRTDIIADVIAKARILRERRN